MPTSALLHTLLHDQPENVYHELAGRRGWIAVDLPPLAPGSISVCGAPGAHGLVRVADPIEGAGGPRRRDLAAGEARGQDVTAALEWPIDLHANLDAGKVVLVEHDVVPIFVKSCRRVREEGPYLIEHRFPQRRKFGPGGRRGNHGRGACLDADKRHVDAHCDRFYGSSPWRLPGASKLSRLRRELQTGGLLPPPE